MIILSRFATKPILKNLKLPVKNYNLLNHQLKMVELMAEGIVPEDAEDLAANQVQLESLMTRLILDYRDVKKQLFALVESLIRENSKTIDLNA